MLKNFIRPNTHYYTLHICINNYIIGYTKCFFETKRKQFDMKFFIWHYMFFLELRTSTNTHILYLLKSVTVYVGSS